MCFSQKCLIAFGAICIGFAMMQPGIAKAQIITPPVCPGSAVAACPGSPLPPVGACTTPAGFACIAGYLWNCICVTHQNPITLVTICTCD
jgi:hypothetical protein